eukprot:scaffold34159_cov58-Phaeocystis_antarctica.AAC.3
MPVIASLRTQRDTSRGQGFMIQRLGLPEAAALRLLGVDALRLDEHLEVCIVRLTQPLLAGGPLALLACQRLLCREQLLDDGALGGGTVEFEGEQPLVLHREALRPVLVELYLVQQQRVLGV